jgi:ubiquinone/menaquinone biosynthesis C-methylase UbiE
MAPREVAASYDRIAGRWSHEQFDLQNGIAQHERALSFLPGGGGVALDVGCGASGRIIDLLRGRGLRVEGLDLSVEMLRLARIRHPDVLFHHADICDWAPGRDYAFGKYASGASQTEVLQGR